MWHRFDIGSRSRTYTNTRKTGSIELTKVWSGTAGDVTFDIGTTQGGSDVDTASFVAADTPPLSTGPNTVDTGSYFVSETDLSADYNTTLACVDTANANAPVTVNATTGELAVGENQTVVCTYTNKPEPLSEVPLLQPTSRLA